MKNWYLKQIGNLKKTDMFFSVLIFFSLVFILFSNPFLKIPYDPWHHIIYIRSIYDDGVPFLFYPLVHTYYTKTGWHHLVAYIFKILHISDFFYWVKIIHVVQFFLSAFSVFFLSSTIYRVLYNKQAINKYLALSSTYLWFIGVGTLSVCLQQSWIVWYSLTPHKDFCREHSEHW